MFFIIFTPYDLIFFLYGVGYTPAPPLVVNGGFVSMLF